MKTEKGKKDSRTGWLGKMLLVWCGWLLCAAMCLFPTIELEGLPRAYSFVFPAAMAVLFSNILVFIFISSRYGDDIRKLFKAVFRICLSESILLFLLFFWAKNFIGA